MLKSGVYLPEKPMCISGGERGSVKEMLQPKQAEQMNVAMVWRCLRTINCKIQESQLNSGCVDTFLCCLKIVEKPA